MVTAALIALFIVGLLVSVAVHEGGHFLFARKFRMAVSDFSVGFGPRVLTWRRNGIAYNLRALPLGGFVKIHGMRPSGALPDEPNGVRFVERPAWQRAVVAFAGPAANVLFAWVLLIAIALALPMATGDGGTERMGPVEATAAGTLVMVEVTNATVTGFAEVLQPAALADDLSSGYAGDPREGDGVMSIVGVGGLIAAMTDGGTLNAEALLSVVMLLALINIALAVFNLIPFVPLDGGHAALAVIEGTVSRVRRMVDGFERWFLPEKLVSGATIAGIAVLLAFGLSIIVLDIVNPVVLPA